MSHSIRFLLLLFSVAWGSDSFCQELSEKNFDQHNKFNGLSHDNVTGIAQDATGYLWASTSYGINRFDGSRFVQFHTNNDDQAPASEEITGTVVLDKDRIAFYASGVHIINTRTGTHHNIFIPYHDKQYMFKYNMVMKVLSDPEKNIYILSRSGLYKYDSNYVLKARFDYYKDEEVPFTHFYFGQDLLDFNEQYLLIVSDNGLYLFDKKKGAARKMSVEDSKEFADFLGYPAAPYTFVQFGTGKFFVFKQFSHEIIYVDIGAHKKVISHLPFANIDRFAWRTKLFKLDDTTLYFTDQGTGFYKTNFDAATGRLKFYGQKYFQKFLCNGMLADKENNLWVATNMGLFRQNTHRNAVTTATVPNQLEDKYPGMKIDDVSILNGKVYATARGGGLLVFDQPTFGLTKQVFFPQYPPRANIIRGIIAVNNSTLLLAADGYPMLFDTKKQTTSLLKLPAWNAAGDWIADVCKDHAGNIWISSSNLYRYHPGDHSIDTIRYKHLLPENPAAIHAGTDGNTWIAGHGVARYDNLSEKFDLLLDSFPFLKMPDKQVNDVVTDNRHRVWFNSRNNGVIVYDPATKSILNFTKKDGLADNNVTSMIIVGNDLWLAGYLGISCINLNSHKITRFGKQDGFPDLPISKDQKFFYDSITQLLYVGFSNKLVRFNPLALLRQQIPPHTFIENVAVGNEASYYLPKGIITTPWNKNSLAITIGCINFSNGDNQVFAYRISGADSTSWQLLGTQPSFNITALPPGETRIQVKSYALDNRWEEQVQEIIVKVLPPFWMQTWFLTLALVLLAALVYLFVKWRIGNVRKKEMEKTRVAKLRADDYKNQFELEQISNYFSSSLSDKKSEEDILWDVTENLMSRMHYEDCVIYLWNSDKTKMLQKAAYGPKGQPQIISEDQFEVLPGQGIVGNVMQIKRPVLVNDTRKDSRYRVDDAVRLSEIAVPIIHDNELLGVLDSENSNPDYYTERDVKILTTIATLIGNKLIQLQSEKSLEIKQKEIAEMNAELAEAKLSALQAQMNPHFVFNALNSIKRLILEEENEKASRYLSRFASMIRMTLDHSRESFVSVEENIKYLREYIEMEKLRFDESFSYSISVTNSINVNETFFPSLIIQPIVENAIWHGLLSRKENKILEISFTSHQQYISCTVTDNGIGIRQSEKDKELYSKTHRSIGLENLQKRIRILNEKYQTGGTLDITDLGESGIAPHGTRVALTFRNIHW